MSALERMNSVTQRWFTETFPKPTAVQELGWTQIASGAHTLMLAPTGSGKTLAAFLFCLDQLAFGPPRGPGYGVIYVSPLKALAYDVERNLTAPLAGLGRTASAMGAAAPNLIVDVRTGDTSMPDRRRQARRPGDILITTPESLYLLLGSKARWALAATAVVIIDELHALAPHKRGVHLALSLERLSHLVRQGGRPEPQRIGLSATLRPLDVAARYLGGTREVKIVDTGERPTLELQVIAPVADMAAAASPDRAPRTSEAALPPSERGGMWPAIYPRLLELILAHRSTIVFVNSRRLAERLAQQLCELHAATSAEPTDEPAPGPVGPALVRAHHGSISRHEREHIEGELKAGRLRAITATSSLELGIDMGAVDLVVQLESPGSVARGLQRIGRANHHIGGAPRGRMIPKFRGDLLEMAAVTAAMLRGEVEPLTIPENCLDVLAQQVVAMCSWESWPVDELALVLRRSASYAGLGDAALTSVLDMLSGRYPSDELTTLRPRLTWDRPRGVLTARRGARMLAVTNAGTISDRGLYPVMLGDGGPRIGELDEEMVHESRPGETFLLGASTWRIEQITRDRVIVSPAPGEPGKMPFWRGDRPGRPVELGLAMGALCRRVELALRQEQEPALLANLEAQHCFDPPAAQNLLAYVAQELAAAGAVPTDEVIVVERFRDEVGDWRVCLLSPLGARVLAPWAMLLQHTLQARLGYPVHPSYTDDGIALRFPDGDAGPKDEDLFPDPDLAEEVLWAELPRTAMFAGHFRENAARALLLPRRRPGQRTPLWSQRLRAQQLMGVALRYPAFPIVLETYRECLRDVFDVPALLRVLQEVRARTLRVESVVTRAPSPFARSLAFNYVAAYLYEGDAPMAERRAAALSLDRGLLRELLGERELGALLDPRVIEEVERELQGLAPRRARDADELWDLLQRLGDLSDEELAARYAGDAGDAVRTLAGAGRALLLPLAGGAARWIASEDAARYRDALGVELPQGLPAERLGPVPDALPGLLARYARNHGPFEADDLARRYGVDAALIEGALDVLVERGQLERGSFLPAARGPTLCDVEVLRRVRRGSLTRARQAIAAVSPTQFSRFVLRWHGIAGDSPRASVRRHGLPALRAAIAQLEGLALSFRELEARILPARVADYAPRMLDELGATGEVVWIGRGALGSDDGRIILCRRAQAQAWLVPEPAAPPPPEPPPEPPAEPPPLASPQVELGRALLRILEQGGAAFLVALEAAAPPGTDRASVRAALWDLVWSGQITNDTFAPLRSLGASAGRRTSPATAFGGRWSLVAQVADPRGEHAATASAATATATAHARAVTLLERWGVVGRNLNAVEEVPLGPVFQVLGAMEDAGKVRRGFFVEGLLGAQLALPGALDRLRAEASAADRDGVAGRDDVASVAAAGAAQAEVVALAAVDPANLWGGVFPWPVSVAPVTETAEALAAPTEPTREVRPMRRAGALVVLIGGACVLHVEPKGRRAITFTADPSLLDRALHEGLLAVARLCRRRSVTLEFINGQPVTHGPLADSLARAGARREYRGWVLEAR